MDSIGKKTSEELIIGWLEEKILEQVELSNDHKLDIVIYETLRGIFGNKHDYANPGKVLVLETIRNQKISLYEFDHKNGWILNSVNLCYNNNLLNKYQPRIYRIEDFTLDEIEISVLRKIVDFQLKKFINLD